MLTLCLLSLPCLALAAVSVIDPSDVIPPAQWAADNALIANYNVPFHSAQPSPLLAQYAFYDDSTAIDHESFSTTANDTSVIVAANGAELNLSFVDITKFGYSSDLLAASFFGFNAAINIVSLFLNAGDKYPYISGRQTHLLPTLTTSTSQYTMVRRIYTCMARTA